MTASARVTTVELSLASPLTPMSPQDTLDLPESGLRQRPAWQPRRRIDDGESPLLWRLALAAATAIVVLAAAGSLLV